MIQGSGGSVYAVGAANTAIASGLIAMNLDVTSVTIEFAISINSTIVDNERCLPPITLAPGDFFSFADIKLAMRATEGMWCRAVGTTPNATFRASVLEVAP